MEPLSVALYSARGFSLGSNAKVGAETPDFTVEDLKDCRHSITGEGLNSLMSFLIRLPSSPLELGEDLWVVRRAVRDILSEVQTGRE